MPDPQAPVAEPSLLNEPQKALPAEPTPESKLFPEPKPAEPTPAEPPKATPEPKAAEPEPKKEEPAKEPPKPPSPGAPPAPVDYESLKLPEGSLLSPTDLDVIKKDAKDNGLTLEEAQGILEVKNDAVKTYSARQSETLAKVRKEWVSSWSKDPEYGGDKLAQSTELAKRAWDKLADTELKTLADQTGFGDHPAVLRMMARIGKLFSEDQLIRGNVGAVPKQKPPEEILYGGTTPGPDEPMT